MFRMLEGMRFTWMSTTTVDKCTRINLELFPPSILILQHIFTLKITLKKRNYRDWSVFWRSPKYFVSRSRADRLSWLVRRFDCLDASARRDWPVASVAISRVRYCDSRSRRANGQSCNISRWSAKPRSNCSASLAVRRCPWINPVHREPSVASRVRSAVVVSPVVARDPGGTWGWLQTTRRYARFEAFLSSPPWKRGEDAFVVLIGPQLSYSKEGGSRRAGEELKPIEIVLVVSPEVRRERDCRQVCRPRNWLFTSS